MTSKRDTDAAVEITKATTYDLTKIYFNGVAHLVFVRAMVAGFQTWRSHQGLFVIELTFKDGAAITSEYDTEEKWKQVIALIEENLTP